MGWLATLFGGAYYAASGPKKSASAAATPPINASSSDEADFIKCVIYIVHDAQARSTNWMTGNSLRSRTRSTKQRNSKMSGVRDSVSLSCTY